MNARADLYSRNITLARALRAADGLDAPPWWAPFTEREITRARLVGLIEELLDLRDSTRPELGDASQDRKYNKAIEAKTLVHQVARISAGWAFDHLVGVAVLAGGLRRIDTSLSATAYNPSSEKRRGKKRRAPDPNSHENETAGRQVENLSADQFRHVQQLTAGVGTDSAYGTLGPHEQFLQALDDLDHGRTSPMLRPARRRSKVRSYLWLYALQYIEFWNSHGRARHSNEGRSKQPLVEEWQKEKLAEKVAEAYGLETGNAYDTMRKEWVAALKRRLGVTEVEQILGDARDLATLLVDEGLEETGIPDYAHHAYSRFGEAALADQGAQYRDLVGG